MSKPFEWGWAIWYYDYDGLGSVSEIVDWQGVALEKYTYDEYGSFTIKDGSGTPLTSSPSGNRFYFTGREYDFLTRLYYYRARWYDPAIGRFLQVDPVGYDAGDINLYRYCRNNPINFIDPLGLTLGSAIAQGSLLSGGLGVAAYGIATGNVPLAAGGLIAAGIGAGWMWYDWITAPDIAEQAAQNIYEKYLKEHYDELDKISGNKK